MRAGGELHASVFDPGRHERSPHVDHAKLIRRTDRIAGAFGVLYRVRRVLVPEHSRAGAVGEFGTDRVVGVKPNLRAEK